VKIPLVQRVDFIKRAAAGRSVLHLGCTNQPYTKEAIDEGMLLHFDLQELASELYGFDYDLEGIKQLAAYGCGHLYQADLELLEEVDLEKKFEVIIAGEIIEHLNNPGAFLNGIKRFMTSESKLIITTINAYSGMRFFIYALRGKGGANEPVHPDHVAYYSFSTLRLVLERHSLEIENFLFYDLGSEHRAYNRRLFNFVNDVAVKFTPQLSDGLIAVCKLPAGQIADSER
jgi:hypothetical protein